MLSLVETSAGLAIAATLLATTLTAMQQAVRIGARAEDLCEKMFVQRQFESLIDHAALAAGSGPAHPPALQGLTDQQAVFGADLDGDGIVSESGSETTAVEIVNDASRTRLRHRLGRQTMTVLELDHASAGIVAYDRFGHPTMALTASLLAITVQTRAALTLDAAGDGEELHLQFAIPEAARR